MSDFLDQSGAHEQEARKASLQVALNNLVRQYDGKVGMINSASVGKSQAIITAREGFNMVFDMTYIEGEWVPTVQAIDLKSESGRGYGKRIITTWEQSFPQAKKFAANVVTNPKFWGEMGYQPYQNTLWLKRLVPKK